MKRFAIVSGMILALGASMAAQDMSTTWKHGSDRTKCEDLVITSSDYEVARGEQQVTADAKEVTQLNLEGSKNGGIYISGWDQAEYQISACKAAFAETMPAAQQILAGINVARNGSQVTTSGPDVKFWTVTYIVRVPRGANLTASTYNGPVSVRDVEGKLNVKSHNGPLSIKKFSGDITGETQNGPVSFAGKSGNINLSTVNGPVDVRLEGTQWNGELDANTKNGPVSLHLPENFESAFVVEGGWGPMSCSSSICGKANKIMERGNHRIEFGDAPKIKASTHNGPISVAPLNGEI